MTKKIKPWQHLLTQSLREVWARKTDIFTPLLFAITILAVFHFVMSDFAKTSAESIFVAEIYMALLFSTQLIQSRIFMPESNDKAYQLFKCHSLSGGSWFLAKFIQGLLLGSTVMIPIMGFASLILSGDSGSTVLFSEGSLIFALLSLAGLTALGALLTLMTLQIPNRETIFSTMFFPLAIPVLLSGSEGSVAHLKSGDFLNSELCMKWLLLLVCFNAIYFTLGYLLFSEIIEQE